MYAAGMHLGTYIVNSAHTDTVLYYDHADWLGTERARTDLSGNACEKISSLHFGDGESITSTCGDLSALHFTGDEHDSETGLDHSRFRQYSGNLGRFLSPDPLSLSGSLTNPQNWNRYGRLKIQKFSFSTKFR